MTRKEVVQEVISLIRTLGSGIITAILAVSIYNLQTGGIKSTAIDFTVGILGITAVVIFVLYILLLKKLENL
jgi:hypothetical protein